MGSAGGGAGLSLVSFEWCCGGFFPRFYCSEGEEMGSSCSHGLPAQAPPPSYQCWWEALGQLEQVLQLGAAVTLKQPLILGIFTCAAGHASWTGTWGHGKGKSVCLGRKAAVSPPGIALASRDLESCSKPDNVPSDRHGNSAQSCPGTMDVPQPSLGAQRAVV